jgi:RNA polymerase sigma-70 factor (family 1)
MQSSSDTTTLSASSIHPDHAIVLNDSVPDDILVQWMQAGSKPAFDLIYRRYWKALYHLAFNLFRDRIVCEDIVQDVFFQLWDKGGSLQIQTLRSYLFAATRHGALKVIKSKKAFIDIDSVQDFLTAYGESDSDVLEKDLAHQASMAISMLPEKCREIFVLSRKHAMPVAQIAQHLELSPKTVENQITIALKKLRSSLSDYFVVMIITSFLQA